MRLNILYIRNGVVDREDTFDGYYPDATVAAELAVNKDPSLIVQISEGGTVLSVHRKGDNDA